MKNKIEYYRRQRSMSQVELAKATGYTQGTISMCESGSQADAVLVKYKKIAEALGVSIEDLLEDDEQPEGGGTA